LLDIVLCIIEPVISNCDRTNLQNISVTLTFEGTWFLDVTACCYEIDICAKLFQYPSMHDKITVWTWLLCKWGHTDKQMDMSLSRDTLSWCGRHLYYVILKSFHAWQSYSPDMNVYLQTLLKWMSTFKL
jgi:hypothetical protein